MNLVENDLEKLVFYLNELTTTPYEEVPIPMISLIALLHTTVYADWGQTPWESKLRLLISYYTQCSVNDLEDLEIRLITEALDFTLEAELIPSIQELPTLIPTASERPTTRIKH